MDPNQPPVGEAPATAVPEPQHHLEQLNQANAPVHHEHQVAPDQTVPADEAPREMPHPSETEAPTIVPTVASDEPTLPPASYHNGYSSDSRAHYEYTTTSAQDPHPQPSTSSRPSSGLSVTQKQPSQPSKNSVVIKVGMVGDAQIGKTSLMVKYVEGSWDEDYIQTLGRSHCAGRRCADCQV